MRADIEDRIAAAGRGLPGPRREAEMLASALAVLPAPGRRPRRVRRIAGWALAGAGAAAGIAALAMLLVAAPDAPKRQPTADPSRISLLERPRRQDDRLPAWIAGQDAVAANAIDPASARLARRSGRRVLYLARGRASDARTGRPTGVPTICLVDAVASPPGPGFRPGNPGTVDCVVEDVFFRQFLSTSRQVSRRSGVTNLPGSGRPVPTVSSITSVLTFVVPDGYDRVSAFGADAAVVDNVAAATVTFGGGGANGAPAASGPAGRHAFGPDVDQPSDEGRAFSVLGIDQAGRRAGDRPYVPYRLIVSGVVRPGYTTVRAGGVVARVGRRPGQRPSDRRNFVLRGVPASPFAPTRVVATGPAGRGVTYAFLPQVASGHARLVAPR
jgi:hypothetical protein